MSSTRTDRSDGGLRLMAMKGGGSAIVELLLTMAGQAYTTTEFAWERLGPGVDPELCALNPLGQVPTLVSAHAGVLTESVAIALYLDDLAPRAGLLPDRGDERRPQYLRWLIFLASAVYPTFTIGDSPARLVSDRCGQLEVKARSDAQREAYWRMLDLALQASPFISGRFVLDDRPSALDAFLTVMSRWQPRRPWFGANCPRITAIAQAVEAEHALAPVIARNFP